MFFFLEIASTQKFIAFSAAFHAFSVVKPWSLIYHKI